MQSCEWALHSLDKKPRTNHSYAAFDIGETKNKKQEFVGVLEYEISEYADRNTDRCAGDDVSDKVNAAQHSGNADDCGDHKHNHADARVDIQKRHRDNKSRNCMAGGEALSFGRFFDHRGIVVLFIRTPGVDDCSDCGDDKKRSQRDQRKPQKDFRSDPFRNQKIDGFHRIEHQHQKRQNIMERFQGSRAFFRL